MSDYRNVCLDTKGSACTICGSTESVIAHHIDGDRSNNSIENLEPICRSCHGKIHTGADGYEEWFENLEESARIYDGSAVSDRDNLNMYLPPDLVDEMQIRFDELNARHRREHGEPMEKNRDYYTAIVRAALEDESLESILDLDSE